MNGSVQLRIYLRARRGGWARDIAAEVAGFSMEEARLTDIASDRGEFADWDLTEPEAAGCAATTEEEIVMQDEPETEYLPVAALAADTLRGDVRDALLSWIKATPKPWSAMSEDEQRSLAEAADRASREMVRQACQIIAAKERPTIVAQLEQYQEKDGIKATLKLASKGEIVSALHEACGREVLIVTSGYDEVSGEAGPAELDADQPNFPALGEEYDEAA